MRAYSWSARLIRTTAEVSLLVAIQVDEPRLAGCSGGRPRLKAALTISVSRQHPRYGITLCILTNSVPSADDTNMLKAFCSYPQSKVCFGQP